MLSKEPVDGGRDPAGVPGAYAHSSLSSGGLDFLASSEARVPSYWASDAAMDSLDSLWRLNTEPAIAVGRERLAGFGINVAASIDFPGKRTKDLIGGEFSAEWMDRVPV